MATILLQAPSTPAAAGGTFSVQVLVNAAGAPLVSSQFQMSYPANLLTPLLFTFAPGWAQSFDDGDNVMSGGTIVQSGGYPASFRGTMLMGTLTFKALRQGEATLAISNNNTYLFETDGGNLFDGSLASTQVDIGPGTGVAQYTPGAAPAESQDVTSSPTLNASSSAPAVSSDITFLGIPLGVWIVALLLLCVCWAVYRSTKKRRTKRR